jgi:TetR/AcrR family transcriptional regulator, transcriptional repressor for nem operon
MNKIIHSEIKDEILEKAMLLFWHRGYFNTSIDNIVKETGMSRAVMYKYFRDKQGLFQAILNRYLKNITSKAIVSLEQPGKDLKPLHDFFTQFHPDQNHIMQKYGCLMMATASDYPLHTGTIKTTIENFSSDLHNLFNEVLIRAKAENAMSETVDSKTTASFLVGNTFGLMALFRSGADKSVTTNFIEGICEYIKTLSSTAKELSL